MCSLLKAEKKLRTSWKVPEIARNLVIAGTNKTFEVRKRLKECVKTQEEKQHSSSHVDLLVIDESVHNNQKKDNELPDFLNALYPPLKYERRYCLPPCMGARTDTCLL